MIIPVDKEKILNEFNKKYINGYFEKSLSKLSDIFRKNQKSIENEILIKFKENCDKAKTFQNEGLKQKIKYIYFSFLRTNIIEDKGVWRLEFLDRNWFFDSQKCSCDIDFSWVYEEFFNYMDEVMEKRKEYGRIITEMDIEKIKLIEADKYHVIPIEIIKNIINEFLESEEFKRMAVDKEILIFAGEYMDDVVLLYSSSNIESEAE